MAQFAENETLEFVHRKTAMQVRKHSITVGHKSDHTRRYT